MPQKLPLPTLLSYALVSYTIEFDNEAERCMAHYTTRKGKREKGEPWLVSLAMYSNCMRLVDDKGIPAADLVRQACAKPNFSGMSRWGYITVDPSTKLVRATRAGMAAREVWAPLFAAIEERWSERFGKKLLGELRTLLTDNLTQIEIRLPEALPILKFDLGNEIASSERSPARSKEVERLPLSAPTFCGSSTMASYVRATCRASPASQRKRLRWLWAISRSAALRPLKRMQVARGSCA